MMAAATTTAKSGRPLDGLVVLDLTHMLSGPYGTMLLADLGARTIKVEPPGTGEQTRRLLEHDPDYSVRGMGAYFLALNRNKQSIAINLKSEAGRGVFLDLVRQADVVVDNFAAGVTRRLGIDYEQLQIANPAIIACSITGFGQEGPGAARPAFDQVVQAMSGAMSITGDEEGGPMRSGIPIGDLGGGLFATIGVLAALQERQRTGRGQHVDVSMLDCQISLLSYIATMQLMSDIVPQRVGNGHSIHVPYNCFPTSDGHVVVACIGDEFFHRFVECMELDELRDVTYRQQAGRLSARKTIEAVISARMAAGSTTYWLQRLSAAKIPCGPVNNIAQSTSDPQVRDRGMIVPLDLGQGRTVEVPGNPLKFSRTAEARYDAPPTLGHDTDRILRELLQYPDDKIGAVTSAGAVA
jgi:crotonobetainyl-CoA:carnitine CoA-transferase CaiB-like acyl-CoA transferase